MARLALREAWRPSGTGVDRPILVQVADIVKQEEWKYFNTAGKPCGGAINMNPDHFLVFFRFTAI